MSESRIYLDYQATTPVDSRVLDAMLPYFQGSFGNASSAGHAYGWEAEEAVKMARESVADCINSSPSELIFTSGATESNNMALLGTARALRRKGKRIITLKTEHKATLDPCAQLKQEGFEVLTLDVDTDGLVDMDELARAMTADTILVSIMAANNEIGVLQPLEEIGALAAERGALFHTDAAQAAGKIPLDVTKQNIHLLSISGHKVYGPKGVGALYVRRRAPRVNLKPLVFGGGQERNLRSGTLNVPGIVGLAEALRLAREEMTAETKKLTRQRDWLWQQLRSICPQATLNGHPHKRLAGNLNVHLPGIPAAQLMTAAVNLALSTGSACTSGSKDPSHVLKAIGRSDRSALESIRIGLGRQTTDRELETCIQSIKRAVAAIQAATAMQPANVGAAT